MTAPGAPRAYYVRRVGPGFTGREAADIVGITYRQLDYWARTDLVRPSIADAHGSDSRRRYALEDLILLKLIKTMLDVGVRLDTIRPLIHGLQDDPISDGLLVIVSEGSARVIGREDLLNLDLNQPCQIFPIDIPDVDAEMERIYPHASSDEANHAV